MSNNKWIKNNSKEIISDARKLFLKKNQSTDMKRRFLLGSATIGGLSLLTGCDILNSGTTEAALMRISKMNDVFQGWLFDQNRLAPTYHESMITRPFPFNAFYAESQAPHIAGDDFKLKISGLVEEKKDWNLHDLRALPQHSQITRHICVEGWSAIGKWGGVMLSDFLRAVGADLNARFVGFECADDYYTSIDMATALHPQTIIALDWDGEILPTKYGFPMKIRIPTKLGYKNPKHVTKILVSNTFNKGYWEDQGYNWFGGV